MAASLLRSFHDLLHWRFGLSEADIVRYRIGEQVDTLEHEAVVFHEGVHAVFAYIPAVKGNSALVHVPKA